MNETGGTASEGESARAPRPRVRWEYSRPTRWVLSVILALAVVFLSFGVDRRIGLGLYNEWEAPRFYQLSTQPPSAAPGTIVRSERLMGAPGGAIAWRVLYHSTDVLGNDIVVSGIVVAPNTPAPPGGRTVISWAHATTGAVQRCAPSVGIDPFISIEGLDHFIRAGYVVAATDYSGMGADGPDSYLIGTTEGNNVIDAARAARALPTGSSDRLVMWGHSQGGQATLFAAQDAVSYAPELTLKAAAVAAPAADIGALMNADIGDVSGVTISSYAFTAYAAVYGPSTGADLHSILSDPAIAVLPKMADLCLLGQNKELHAYADKLIGSYLVADPTTTEPWASLLAENTPGAVPLTVPLFVAQGEVDTLVHPDLTAAFVAHERSIGTDVTYHPVPDTGHGLVAERSLPTLMRWLDSVGAGAR